MTKRQITIALSLSIVILAAAIGLYMLPKQDPRGNYDMYMERLASDEDVKELQAILKAGATATADFLTMTTPTPDATVTRNYLYTHMDEFVSPLATTMP